MPGTIKIGNEGFRATLETSGSDNDLILKNVNGQQMLISSNNINFYSGSLVSNNRIKFIQDTTSSGSRAIIHLSSSDAFKGGYNIDTPKIDRAIRANYDLHASGGEAWIAGARADTYEYQIRPTIVFSDSAPFRIKQTSNNAGDVIVSGSLSVDGALSATRKSFDIPHPSKPDKRLVYGSLEGPEFGVYIRGKIENDDKIPIPDYWSELVDFDTLSVHLTQINSKKPIYFTFSDNTYIYINKKFTFFYFICAERKDIDKLEVEL